MQRPIYISNKNISAIHCHIPDMNICGNSPQLLDSTGPNKLVLSDVAYSVLGCIIILEPDIGIKKQKEIFLSRFVLNTTGSTRPIPYLHQTSSVLRRSQLELLYNAGIINYICSSVIDIQCTRYKNAFNKRF